MFRNRAVLSVNGRNVRNGVAAGLIGIVFGPLFTSGLAQVAPPTAVETAPLATDAFSTGTLDRATGALLPTLWRSSDPQQIDFLLETAPAQPATPSLGEAMKRILLSPGTAPDGAPPSLGGKKILALAKAGFLDEARTIASISSDGRQGPWAGQAGAVMDLLTGDAAAACRRGAALSSGRDDLFWVKLRVFCYSRASERDAADLTLNILREQGAVTETDDLYLSAAATGVQPKTPAPVKTALHYAIGKLIGSPLAPGLIKDADGGVLVAVSRDPSLSPETRIAAAQRAIAMGVLNASQLQSIIADVSFDVAEISNAPAAARDGADNPLTDALLYQSVQEMSAPEFIRDKAQRIALALSIADSFPRAYALSLLYADDIAALEGVLLSPEEAAQFAKARMAVGDSVGAAQWLSVMIGVNDSIAALPEPQAMAFIEQVNLLAMLDPLTAARIARSAGVSLLSEEPIFSFDGRGHEDPALLARILEASFDAVSGAKAGQAGLAALAASAGSAAGGEIEAVMVSQTLAAAGLGDLNRRHEFEHAWASVFPENAPVAQQTAHSEMDTASEDDGFTPRLKPQRTQ